MPVDPLLRIYSHSRFRLAPQTTGLDPADYHTWFDDFNMFDPTATVGRYAIVEDGTPAQVQIDAAGGVVSIATDVNIQDEAYVSSIAENWLFAANKPLWFEARVACTEAATNKANLIVGLSDTVGANSLLDTAGGPMASYDGAVWFKVANSLAWQFESSNAGTQVTNATAGTFVSNTWFRVGFLFNPNDGTTGIITPALNGVRGTPHNITLAGLEEMHILLGLKAGSAAAETLRVDYVKVIQAR